MLDGEIVLTGRHKEMTLLNGRNIWPQDIEKSIIGLSSPVIKKAVAFSIDQDELIQIIILAEHPTANKEADRVAKQAIAARLLTSSGISAQVELVAPRSLPDTSSGKPARAIVQKMYMSGKFLEAWIHVLLRFNRLIGF